MTSNPDQPLVSIVTPVYNGARYLRECIESVLRQTYNNWEYVLVNNCSTDDTLAIAQEYSRKDQRIRIHNNTEFLKVMPNWNHALRQISPESKYCKIIHADDRLFPDCVARMVEVAENNPTVVIVGSYRLFGTKVNPPGFSCASTVIPGREVCRATLAKEYYVFGSPSTTLIRSDVIRKRNVFYNEEHLHADVEACFEVLQEGDFGFVHQILSHSRVHDARLTATVAQKYQTGLVETLLGLLKKYGPTYCSEKELELYWRKALALYYRVLARSVFKRKPKDFWQYHRQALQKIGLRLSIARLVGALLLIGADLVLNPKSTVEKVARRIPLWQDAL